jgi:hydroxypyruvate reductase
MRELLPRNRAARVVVVDAGKAAGRIAADLETIWQADPLVGVVVVPYDHRTPTSSIAVMEASHPVPDRAGLSATKALFDR